MRAGGGAGGGGGGDRFCPFLENGKKVPDFEEKSPDCGHLLVKFF